MIRKFFPKTGAIALTLGLVLGAGGCAGFKGDTLRSWFGLPPKNKTDLADVDEAQALAQRGQEQMEADEYKAAAETFRRLKDQYPYSRYAILAELRLGDALFNLGKYLEAQTAYEDFERLHPQNEAVPYALYQQGMCNFLRMTGIDRDQTPTIQTIQTFARLAESYPDSQYTAMAQARIAEAQNVLAGHEFYIGEFYYRQKAYKAALNRFTGLVRYYPDSGYHHQALDYIAKCRVILAEKAATGEDANARGDGARPEDALPPAVGMF